MKITISGTNKKHLDQVKELAKKLGLRISLSTVNFTEAEREKRRKKAIKALKELRKIGTFKNIKDPVAWQREVREDRNIGWDD